MASAGYFRRRYEKHCDNCFHRRYFFLPLHLYLWLPYLEITYIKSFPKLLLFGSSYCISKSSFHWNKHLFPFKELGGFFFCLNDTHSIISFRLIFWVVACLPSWALKIAVFQLDRTDDKRSRTSLLFNAPYKLLCVRVLWWCT